MPTYENTRIYAMYVIGEVESGWDWTGVYRADPITLGMMQNYGLRARNLLALCKEGDSAGYETFAASAPQLAADVDNHPDDYNWWTSRYVTDTEAVAWQTMATRDENHVIQQQLWYDDFAGYWDLLGTWGFNGNSNPQTMIYAMSMYHQSPRECQRVIQSCGANATLSTLHATCLNNAILGIYTNRYNTVYGRLSSWDGESAPPDFGQVNVDDSAGGNPGGTPRPQSSISRVELRNGQIILYGVEGYSSGLVCYLAGPNIWIPATQVAGEENPDDVTGGGDTKDGAAIIEYGRSKLGQWYYSNGAGRLDPESSGVTDCSGFVYWCYYHIAGINLMIDGAAYTGTLSQNGEEIWRGTSAHDMPWDSMQAADIILMTGDPSLLWNFAGYWCHVELYTGEGTSIIGCPSGAVPTEKEGIAFIDNYGAVGIMVRRIPELS